jgi:hypothetical protein
VDALEQSDIEFARRATPEQKLAQALQMMADGLRLKRQQLHREHPAMSDAELEKLYLEWLFRDE